MKKVLLIALFAVFSLNAAAQTAKTTAQTVVLPRFDLADYGVRIEPDKRVMTVLAALEAAGINTPLSEKGAAFRSRLQADLQDLRPDLRQKLKTFVDQYKRRHPKESLPEIVSPFVSMAYTLSPTPDLTDPARTADLPGDLLEVLDFAPLVREFYRSSFGSKIDGYLKDYQTAGDDLRRPTALMVAELLDYLHTKPRLTYIERVKTNVAAPKGKKQTLERIETREHERRFFIVPELLASKGTINFRNVGDDYYTIVPPGANLNSPEVRRTYLQYVIDPLVAENAKDIGALRPGIKALLDARRTENPDLSPDVFLAVSRSLVAAIEAKETEFQKTRIATEQARYKIDRVKTIDEKKAVSAELEAFKKSLADETALQLSEADERGAVLAFYFADQLKGFEGGGFDVAGSLRDIILSLDPAKETNRSAQFAEARNRALLANEARRKTAANSTVETSAALENPVTKKLFEIDKVVQTKNYAEAEKQLKQLLEQNPNESPRIYYSLGRVASLSAEGASEADTKRRLLEAKVAYENVIRSASPQIDPKLMSLTYVALARIYEFYDEPDYAANLYDAAIKVGDVAGGAYKEAAAAKERLTKQP